MLADRPHLDLRLSAQALVAHQLRALLLQKEEHLVPFRQLDQVRTEIQLHRADRIIILLLEVQLQVQVDHLLHLLDPIIMNRATHLVALPLRAEVLRQVDLHHQVEVLLRVDPHLQAGQAVLLDLQVLLEAQDLAVDNHIG